MSSRDESAKHYPTLEQSKNEKIIGRGNQKGTAKNRDKGRKEVEYFAVR